MQRGDGRGLPFVVYFAQLFGATHTQKLVKKHCWKMNPKRQNWVPPQGVEQLLGVDKLYILKKVWNEQKCLDQLLGAGSTQNLVKKHITQFIKITFSGESHCFSSDAAKHGTHDYDSKPHAKDQGKDADEIGLLVRLGYNWSRVLAALGRSNREGGVTQTDSWGSPTIWKIS